KAIRFYEEALHHGGPEAQLHNNIGALYLQQGRLEQALPHLERVAALKPSDAHVRYTLGVVFARLGRMDKAMVALRTSVQLDPSDQRTQQALAQVQQLNTASQ
ncbi:MAG TPA: tetratricopeptide repeat protein, partial [Flavobacteriales bacterium]|nr:tetratricopeptide repeat protein [Flavobacteriales bacterium]